MLVHKVESSYLFPLMLSPAALMATFFLIFYGIFFTSCSAVRLFFTGFRIPEINTVARDTHWQLVLPFDFKRLSQGIQSRDEKPGFVLEKSREKY